MKKIYISVAVMMALPSFGYAKLPSLNFIDRGMKHCKGHCDQKNIKCQKGVNKQGYFDWCVKNCLHEKKVNLQEFVAAKDKCEKQFKQQAAPPVKTPPRTPPKRKDLGFDPTKADGQNNGNAEQVVAEVLRNIIKPGQKVEPTWEEVRKELMQLPRTTVNFNENTAKAVYKEIFDPDLDDE